MPDNDNPKLAKAAFMEPINNLSLRNPWHTKDVDKLSLGIKDYEKEYADVVEACRFFYRRDPLASTVINKLIDIGITRLELDDTKLTNNERKIIHALLDELQDFSEILAMEFLISGLVIPEVEFSTVQKEDFRRYGIKRFSSLKLPTSMWVRDPATVVIKSPLFLNEPAYFVKIPDDIITFILNKGKYLDGTEDRELYDKLLKLYPDFVQAVLDGKREIKLENPYVLRRRISTDNPYPIPYMYSALESLKHKRNLRRMDYAIASRVIGAIQLIKLGDKDFPLTEDNSEQLEELKNEMYWRNSANRDLEMVFQLFGNHTLQIEWITPPIEALINETKYENVNQDIIFALGFPRILITGETQKSGTSNAEYAVLSPVKTMEQIRRKILRFLNTLISDVFERNNLKGDPVLRFKPMNLSSFRIFVEALNSLYETGNLSRNSYLEAFGYDFEEESTKLESEMKTMREKGLPEFAPAPFSQQPGQEDNQQLPQEEE